MMIRPFLIGLLTLSGAVHAAQPVNPPGLLSSEIVRPLLEQDPGVAAARAGLEVARQEAGILDKSTYEWTTRATGQQRRMDSGPRYNEWNIGVERTIRLPGKAAADRSIGKATVEESQARNGEALLKAARELMALWVDWLAAERARELAANNLQSIQTSLTAVEKRARAGDASKLDVSIARAELAEHRRLDNDAKTQAAATWSRLSTRFPGLKRQIQALPKPLPIGENAAFFRDRILAESDELKVVQAQMRTAQSHVERARADKIPDPTLGVYTASEVGGQ
ncbi:MAG: TolC family protein, partial [Burkholderiales bacterium]|nr:TolC family protein [Burkholderiales bacterium]